MAAAPAAIPIKPNIAAIIATTRNITVQRSIVLNFQVIKYSLQKSQEPNAKSQIKSQHKVHNLVYKIHSCLELDFWFLYFSIQSIFCKNHTELLCTHRYLYITDNILPASGKKNSTVQSQFYNSIQTCFTASQGTIVVLV